MDMSLGFPQLVLETKENEKGCPMYDSENKNCQVYHDMPLNCQAYPLGYNGEKYFVTDTACQGLGEGEMTAEQLKVQRDAAKEDYEARVESNTLVPLLYSIIMGNLVDVKNLKVHFPVYGGVLSKKVATVKAVDGISLQIKEGEILSIAGESGCGKSTLLNLLAGLDIPSEGEVLIDNTNISTLPEHKRTELRARNLGFVYQFHHLLKDFSSIYNTALPLLISGVDTNQAMAKAQEILKKVGLENRTNHKPSELSGGERQRVAIARAMITCLLYTSPSPRDS